MTGQASWCVTVISLAGCFQPILPCAEGAEPGSKFEIEVLSRYDESSPFRYVSYAFPDRAPSCLINDVREGDRFVVEIGPWEFEGATCSTPSCGTNFPTASIAGTTPSSNVYPGVCVTDNEGVVVSDDCSLYRRVQLRPANPFASYLSEPVEGELPPTVFVRSLFRREAANLVCSEPQSVFSEQPQDLTLRPGETHACSDAWVVRIRKR